MIFFFLLIYPIKTEVMRKPFLFLVALILSSCTTIATHFPGVYAIDVDQGNIIDQEMIDQLRPDMNKRQILYIMGSPMLIDVFHKERWDYVYSIQPGGGDRMEKRIALFFDGENLAGVQGDFRPSNIPVVTASKEETVEVPKREVKKTLWEIITGWFSFDDDDEVPATTAAATDAETDFSIESGTGNTDADSQQPAPASVNGSSEIQDGVSQAVTNGQPNDATILESIDETHVELLPNGNNEELLENEQLLINPQPE